jgi:hypothetical protein
MSFVTLKTRPLIAREGTYLQKGGDTPVATFPRNRSTAIAQGGVRGGDREDRVCGEEVGAVTASALSRQGEGDHNSVDTDEECRNCRCGGQRDLGLGPDVSVLLPASGSTRMDESGVLTPIHITGYHMAA